MAGPTESLTLMEELRSRYEQYEIGAQLLFQNKAAALATEYALGATFIELASLADEGNHSLETFATTTASALYLVSALWLAEKGLIDPPVKVPANTERTEGEAGTVAKFFEPPATDTMDAAKLSWAAKVLTTGLGGVALVTDSLTFLVDAANDGQVIDDVARGVSTTAAIAVTAGVFHGMQKYFSRPRTEQIQP